MKPAMIVVGVVAGKLVPLQSFRPIAVTSSAPRGKPNEEGQAPRPARRVARGHGVQGDTAHAGDAADGEHQNDRREANESPADKA